MIPSLPSLNDKRTRIKICGLTAIRDAAYAVEAGADFIGFLFFAKSPRYVSPKQVHEILAALRDRFPPERIRPVGVFVNAPAAEVWATASYLNLTAVQLHGEEDLDYCRSVSGCANIVRAIRVRDESSLAGLEDWCEHISAFLFDSHSSAGYGGTGETFPHDLARPWVERHPVLIAGGLRPQTVGAVVRSLAPFGVDVSSGVETSPGIKRHALIASFVEEVRRADLMKVERETTGATGATGASSTSVPPLESPAKPSAPPPNSSDPEPDPDFDTFGT